MPKGEHRIGKPPTNIRRVPPTPVALLEDRAFTVSKMLLQNFHRHEIVAFGAKTRNVSPATVDRYIDRAKVIMSEKNYNDLEAEKLKILLQYDDLYQKAYIEKDYGACISIKKAQASLLGVEAPKKIDFTGKINVQNAIEEGDAKRRQEVGNRRAQPKLGS